MSPAPAGTRGKNAGHRELVADTLGNCNLGTQIHLYTHWAIRLYQTDSLRENRCRWQFSLAPLLVVDVVSSIASPESLPKDPRETEQANHLHR